MVVGKGGTKIKEIGQDARVSIEKFLGNKIFLGLRVKVLKDWTRDVAALERMGYRRPS
jgi:GTP-binding protein Era